CLQLRRWLSSSLEWRFRVVQPDSVILLLPAAPDTVIADRWPGHHKAVRHARHPHPPVGLCQITLDVENKTALLLRVGLQANLLYQSVEGRVARLVVRAASTEPVERDTSSRPELSRQ